jgi:hypothetical protein
MKRKLKDLSMGELRLLLQYLGAIGLMDYIVNDDQYLSCDRQFVHKHRHNYDTIQNEVKRRINAS